MTATLGEMLYGLKPWTLAAGGADPAVYGVITGFEHQACELSTFCRNPLHPGPCKGWKKTLGKIAPGALNALQKAHGEKVAARRAARAAAKSEAEKRVATGPAHILTHPLIAKKKTLEHVNTILGDSPEKAQAKAGKAILNKAEIRRFSKLKGAQIGQLAASKGWTDDAKKYAAFAEERIAEALRKDNESGGNEHLKDAIEGIGGALAGGFADKHCGIGSKDGDCDGIAWEALRTQAAYLISETLATGNPDRLNKLEADVAKLDNGPALKAYLKKAGVDVDKIDGEIGEGGDLTPFEKGDKKKVDKIGDVAKAQDKANAGADALVKLGVMSTGKKVSDTQKAQLAGSVQKHQAGEEVSGGPAKINAMIDAGVEKIAAKTKEKLGTGLTESSKKALADEIKAAVNGEGEGKTPLLDALQEEWAKTMQGLLGPGGAKSQEPKVTPGKMMESEHGAGMVSGHTEAALDIAAGQLTPSAHGTINVISKVPKDEFDKLTPEQKESILHELEMAHGSTGDPDKKALAATTYEQLAGEKLPGAVGMHVADVIAKINDPSTKPGPKLDAIATLSKKEFETLAPGTQADAKKFLASAAHGDEPGAKPSLALTTAGALGIDIFPAEEPDYTPSVKQFGPGAKTLSPVQDKASALAMGAKSGTAKMKLAAYIDLDDEGGFGDLSPSTQKLLLADLDKIDKKFLDPKKKAKIAELKAKFQAAAGGGAGAGGKLDSTSPVDVPNATGPAAAVPQTNADKAKLGVAALVELNELTENPNWTPTLAKQSEELLGKFHDNDAGPGSQGDLGIDSMADLHAGMAVEDGPLAGDTDVQMKAKLREPLKADLKEKLKASGAPTPVYDAWKAAVQAKSDDPPSFHAKLIALDDAADAWHNANGDPDTSFDDLTPDVGAFEGSSGDYAKVYSDLHKYALGKEPKKELGQIEGDIEQGFEQGGLEEWAAPGGGSGVYASGLAKSVITDAHTSLGFEDPPLEWIEDDFYADLFEALKNEYHGALVSGKSEPGGVAKAIKGLAADTQAKADALAMKNGWPSDSTAIMDWKKEYYKSKAKQAMSDAVAVNYAGPPAAATAAPVSLDLSAGTSIDHLNDDAVTKILGSFKGLLSSQLASPDAEVFDNLVAVAAASSKDPTIGPVSLMQVMKAVDKKHSQNLGVTNAGLLEAKITKWLQTPAGKKYAEANTVPKTDIYNKLTGEVTLPDGTTLKAGEKVQKLGGPGPYDPKDTSFSSVAPATAAARQRSYKKKTGTEVTKAQADALYTYTTGSGSINNYLRGQGSASSVTKQNIIDIQSAMYPLQENVTLYRGTGWEALPPGFRTKEGARKLIGQTISDDAFMSTSVAASSAFSKPITIEFEAPKGTMAVYVQPYAAPSFKDEKEMLLAAGTKYQVLEVTDNSYGIRMKVRIVS